MAPREVPRSLRPVISWGVRNSSLQGERRPKVCLFTLPQTPEGRPQPMAGPPLGGVRELSHSQVYYCTEPSAWQIVNTQCLLNE